ncbi:hypothetical protein CYR81_00295 [Enterococcus faecalis]|uniref:hypothetical protein n=2 Tax=Enterococcus faecalis TaxID=1351 RepID=UPI000C78FD6D|nr:hypothetical protein [Enterococcus faecalis]EGO2800812.1 hypothetical protein [Enterococcus faecalis]EJB2752949.1 hypothetical protein [Enterococcus faecalis]EKZ0433636.1 hypothetical protein [Enterococcus faecalis]MCB8509249.1 hypothetical protein [Enterococcus faecalis]MCB8511717.1 hypothetical protein [Enterococcus faecalis]
MKGIDQIFAKLVTIDGLIFLPLTVILVGVILFSAWRLNVYYRTELKEERESAKQDRREFLGTLNELKNGFTSMSSDMKRIENKVNEIEREVRK